MANFFSETQTFHSPNRSLFVMDHERLTTCQFGAENIALYEMTLPGDTWKHKSEIFARFMPMLSPVMTRIDCRTESFYVPFRILWENFPKYLRQQSQIDVNHGSVYELPKLRIEKGERFIDKNGLGREVTNWSDVLGPGSILEQIGWQYCVNGDESDPDYIDVPLLPLLAYVYVWHEYFRDENLQPEFFDALRRNLAVKGGSLGNIVVMSDSFTLDDGTEMYIYDVIRFWPFQRAFEKDYFTSSLPWTQKGSPVRIPLNINSDSLQNTVFFKPSNNPTKLHLPNSQSGAVGDLYADQDESLIMRTYDQGWQGNNVTVDNSAALGVRTQISGVTGPTVNEFRAALQLQKWKERNALSGTRYTELLLAHWGVKSSDASLQRPLFLGGSRLPVQISSVDETAQQVGSDVATVGDMYGHGITAGNSEDFEFTFEEHGILMQLITFMPRTSYMQGVRRWLMQDDELDFGWPLLANLGEQPVYQGELYNNLDSQSQLDVFGYQERYCQYKFIPSSVHGSFIDTLRYWHLGRFFDDVPQLNADFILTNSEAMNRIFNYTGTDYDPILVEIYNKTRAIRELPYHAKPM